MSKSAVAGKAWMCNVLKYELGIDPRPCGQTFGSLSDLMCHQVKEHDKTEYDVRYVCRMYGASEEQVLEAVRKCQ